jgi:hypothetical protein
MIHNSWRFSFFLSFFHTWPSPNDHGRSLHGSVGWPWRCGVFLARSCGRDASARTSVLCSSSQTWKYRIASFEGCGGPSQIEPYVGWVLASSVSFQLGSNLRASKFHEFIPLAHLIADSIGSAAANELHRRCENLQMLVVFHAFRGPDVMWCDVMWRRWRWRWKGFVEFLTVYDSQLQFNAVELQKEKARKTLDLWAY